MDWCVEILDSVPSTQDVVKARAQSGAAAGLVIQALQQQDGRGRQAREWVSPVGNLYLSLLLRPECMAADVGKLSLMIGVALARVVESCGGDRPVLKWPNDVLVQGKKCAGILLESDVRADGALNWVAVGFGINIASAPDIGTCLRGGGVDGVRDLALDYIADLYAKPFADVRVEWLSYAHPVGTVLRVEHRGARIEGAFSGIDEAGNLLLNTGAETLRISSGDIYLSEDRPCC